MSEVETAYLVGIRLREVAPAEDYKLVGDELTVAVGDFAVVEAAGGELVGEVRRPRRPLPDFKRDRAFPQVVRMATETEDREWHPRRERAAVPRPGDGATSRDAGEHGAPADHRTTG